MTSRWKESEAGRRWKIKEESYEEIITILGIAITLSIFYGIYRLIKFIFIWIF